MKYRIKLILSALLSVFLLVALSRSWQIGTTTLPAVGTFINPFTGFWNQAESGKSGSQEKYKSDAVKDSVTVVFDKRMIPYIYSSHTTDALYAQGFLHARNRLFQMDLTARSIEGKLSELLGEATLEKDIFMRRLDFPLAIENKLKSWEARPEIMELAEAYIRGVNDYISSLQSKDYPIEYKLLNAAPQPWTIRKVLAVSLSLSATLNMSLSDFGATNALLLLGEEKFNHLYPLFPDTIRPVAHDRKKYPPKGPELKKQDYGNLDYLTGARPHIIDPGIGSNNWAVKAAVTRDSVPMLANDLHLDLTLPSIWYELQMHSPELNVHGVSVPGMPGILIGFNNHVAWGMTNVSIDVMDAYKISWTDKENHIYLLDGEEIRAEERKEIIRIKGKPDHIESIYQTFWGPILYQEDNKDRQDIAIKWISVLPSDQCDFASIYHLMQSKNLADYESALKDFYIPAQNIVFASTEDSVAITVQGKFPIKRSEQGRFVMDGSTTRNDWQGYIPLSDIPREVNPENGFVLSANQWSTYPDYPYHYSGGFNHYRGREISDYLKKEQPLTLEKMKKIQNSTFNLQAAEMVPLLLSFLNADSPFPDFADSLQKWNYYYDASDILPTFTEIWINECMHLVFDEVVEASTSFQIPLPEVWRLKSLLEENPGDEIFDLQATKEIKETAADIIPLAWKVAHQKFRKYPAPERLWGKYAGLDIRHLLRLPAFSHENLFTGGNGNTINAITKNTGPSWRMIVELFPDRVQAQVIYPGGQSGNPGSRYYDNFIEDWVHGIYYPVRLHQTPRGINNPLHYTVNFTPAK